MNKCKCPSCGTIHTVNETDKQSNLLSTFFKTPVYIKCKKCGEMIDKEKHTIEK